MSYNNECAGWWYKRYALVLFLIHGFSANVTSRFGCFWVHYYALLCGDMMRRGKERFVIDYKQIKVFSLPKVCIEREIYCWIILMVGGLKKLVSMLRNKWPIVIRESLTVRFRVHACNIRKQSQGPIIYFFWVYD